MKLLRKDILIPLAIGIPVLGLLAGGIVLLTKGTNAWGISPFALIGIGLFLCIILLFSWIVRWREKTIKRVAREIIWFGSIVDRKRYHKICGTLGKWPNDFESADLCRQLKELDPNRKKKEEKLVETRIRDGLKEYRCHNPKCKKWLKEGEFDVYKYRRVFCKKCYPKNAVDLGKFI